VDTHNLYHPSAETLRAYGLGTLDDTSAEAVHKHLEHCQECQRQVAEMSPDSFLGRLRDAKEEPETSGAGSPAPGLPPTGSTADDNVFVDSSASPCISSTGQVDVTSAALDSPDQASLPSGTRVGYFGDYELLKVLGEGGMGIVYKARQLSLNRPVALKMIKAARFASPDEVRRFQNESEAVARLDHPNILPVFEVGQYEDQHYFSMKLIAGESLDKRPTHYLSDPRRAAELLWITAGAIHHAHQRGILHRDLKPANILVDAEGQPHVTDFGLAKRVEGDSDLTRSGAILGTPAYMAPEQASGKRGSVTTSTDVYGLGAIFYVLLTGKAPFGGDSVVDTLEQVRERLPEPPRKKNRHVPRDLEVICLKCLEKDARRRYASADALAGDLKRWLAGKPIMARPVGNAARFWMWCRRNPVVAGTAGLVAGALVVIAVLSLLYARQQTRLADAGKRYGDEQTRHGQELGASLADSNRRLAMLHFERAQRALDAGQVNHGLLWLLESLRSAMNARDISWNNLARANLSFWRYHCPELRGVFPHRGTGTSPVFSPDGMIILSQSERGAAQLWNVSSGRPMGTPMLHEGEIICMIFSPDGKTVVTGGKDRTAKLWNALTGMPIGQPLKHGGEVNAVACSPDGGMVLTGSTDQTARLWDVPTSEQIGKPMAHRGSVVSVAFSPDGETLLTSSTDGRAQEWDTAGRPIGKPMEHSVPQIGSSVVPFSPGGKFMEQRAPQMKILSYSPGGKFILTASYHETRLWDLATSALVGEPMVHKGQVISAAFSPDGKSVVIGSDDKTARIWDALTGRPIGQPLTHQGSVSSVAFSPDGKTVLTGSVDNTARLWDAADTQPIGRPMSHQNAIIFSAFSPNGKLVLTCSTDNTARLWDASTDQPIGHVLEHRGSVSYVAFSPNGELFLTLGARTDRAVRLWSTATGSPVGQPIYDPDIVSAAAFSSDSKMVVTVSYRNMGRVWDVATTKHIGQPLRLWSAANGEPTESARLHDQVRTVTFSPNNKTFLTESLDGTARLWNATSGQLVMHQTDANLVVFSPDGKIIVTGSSRETARFWDTSTGRAAGAVLEHDKGPVWPLAFSPDGMIIVSGDQDKTVRLWDAATAQPIGRPMMHQSWVTAAAFLADGETILTRSDEMISLWDASTCQPIGQPFVPPRGESLVAFNPKSKTILTRSAGGRMRLWDAPTAQPVGPPLDHGGSIDSVAYSPDGKTIVATASEAKNKVRVWHLPAIVDYDLARIEVWVETITGLSANSQGIIHSFDSEKWRARRELLRQLGGPPKPDSMWMFAPSPPLRSGPVRALRNLYEPKSNGNGEPPCDEALR
jgi:eukaryotic-like serine/threonine-protein kinase